jgi:hypothetical protein
MPDISFDEARLSGEADGTAGGGSAGVFDAC